MVTSCTGDQVKDLEIRRHSWIIWLGPKFHHRCPQKRHAEGYNTHRGRGNVTMEAEMGVTWPQVKKC